MRELWESSLEEVPGRSHSSFSELKKKGCKKGVNRLLRMAYYGRVRVMI